METQTTKGIKINVQATFQPLYSKPILGQFVFSYHISIENQSRDTIQLLRRHWLITDSLGAVREVEGKGVIGVQPILAPGDTHTYDSWCPLTTAIGHMEGDFLMLNTATQETFKAQVPRFHLVSPVVLN